MFVVAGPKEVIIMDEYGQRLRDLIGPYNEGAHLTLICETEIGMYCYVVEVQFWSTFVFNWVNWF